MENAVLVWLCLTMTLIAASAAACAWFFSVRASRCLSAMKPYSSMLSEMTVFASAFEAQRTVYRRIENRIAQQDTRSKQRAAGPERARVSRFHGLTGAAFVAQHGKELNGGDDQHES